MKYIQLYNIIIFLLLLTNPFNSQGQNESGRDHKQNVLHANGATLKFVGMYSINYERFLLSTQFLKININAGAGGWYLSKISETSYGYSMPVSFNSLVGKGNNFFEIDLGLRYTFFNEKSTHDISPLYPIINLGYRYQRQNGKGLIFRAFIGYSGIGIGIGKAF